MLFAGRKFRNWEERECGRGGGWIERRTRGSDSARKWSDSEFGVGQGGESG